ncbi:pyridoxal phosphate-dependent aminotransferase [Paraburkholderia fungorum]|uniref:Aminotransferase n=1 Tax=Paraburkholderia fungorum TaxID=134537 RepID=A0A3R7F3T7_9BURK|nr:pyridoxal phosphate-dependent aminotransferase [Paraburkholderia fungorum]RKF34430.1 aspartate aminotransferase [Paraburkholderia fungorum]
MTLQLASRLGTVKPAATMAAKLVVDRLRAAGKTIVDFTIGEPDFPTPDHIVSGGITALSTGKTKYTAPGGIQPLREAIAQKLLRENDLHFSPDEIVVGAGAKQIIYSALGATLNEGDEVIVPAPYWISYPDIVSLHGGVPIIVPCGVETGFKLTPVALERAITPSTRWLILNSPGNPTGAVYTRAELEGLASVLRAHPHVWVMTDEIYEHFVYGGAEHVSLLNAALDLAPRTLIVNGMSKAYAMTGWRVGYGAGPLKLAKAITLLSGQTTSCVTTMSQIAATVALNGSQTCVEEAVALFHQRRDRMVALLGGIPGLTCNPPDGAFYVFPSVSGLIGAVTPEGKTLLSDLDVTLYFLEHAGVAAIDGSSYGAPSYLRMSFATSIEQIELGCNALKKAVDACTFPLSKNTEQSDA